MAKAKTIFVCSECGNESPKWLGTKNREIHRRKQNRKKDK